MTLEEKVEILLMKIQQLENHAKKIIERAKIAKTPVIQIGKVSKGKGAIVKKNGSFDKLKDLGWEHFS